VVVTDPCPPASGYRIGKLDADVVTISRRDDPGFNFRDGIKPEAKVLDAPGEYEVGGVLINGVAMKGTDAARNVAFIVELDGIKVGHLGVPAAPLSGAQLDDLKGVDILLLPVGGHGSLGGASAADVMTTVDARITIPIGFKTDVETGDFDPLDRFLKETGAKPEPQARIQVTKSGLPAELTMMVLQPR
jgi:L-ascorbate metabolism protein UlaG (beta-lactamase superfamily)